MLKITLAEENVTTYLVQSRLLGFSEKDGKVTVVIDGGLAFPVDETVEELLAQMGVGATKH